MRAAISVALLGAAHGTPQNSYNAEVADLANMMESVRIKTGGESEKPKVVTLATAKKMELDEDAVTDEVMGNADRIMQEMKSDEAPKSTAKKAALPEVSTRHSAARFFAMNGMKDFGAMLG